MSVKVITYDVGTTGMKACMFDISAEESVRYIDGETDGYPLHVLENGGVEPLSMSYEALAAADFQANDHVYACALYTGYADAAQIPDDERVQITKTYTPVASAS